MSEGSYWPKTWKEAIPLSVWGILVFAAGFEGIATLVHGEWLSSIASFVIMVGLTAMLLHWQQLKEWLTAINPNWVVGAVIVTLAAIISLPFIEHQNRPFLTPPPDNELPNKYTWETLTADNALSLRIALRSLPKPDNFRVICVDTECRTLALDFISVFNSAEWAPYLDSKTVYNVPSGMVLYQKDINNRTLADTIERRQKDDLEYHP